MNGSSCPVELTKLSYAGEEGHKPKWTLAHGAGTGNEGLVPFGGMVMVVMVVMMAWPPGPQVLELDRSRSGRLYKPSLGQYGLPSAMYATSLPAGQFRALAY